MVRILIFLLAVGTGFAVSAQKKIDQTYPLKSGMHLDLDLKYATKIKIVAWSKAEVQVKASVTVNNNEMNDAWELKTQKTGDELQIYSEIDKKAWKEKAKTQVVRDENGGWISTGDCWRSEIVYEIYVPEKAHMTVNTYSGNIDLSGLTGKVFAKSLSGSVDMTWDTNKAASFTLKSISGEVFSNLDLDIQNRKENPYVGYALRGDFKGGGTSLHLESISNNVYLRKK